MAMTPDSHAIDPGFKSRSRPTKDWSPSTPIPRLQVAKMRQERGHVGWRTLSSREDTQKTNFPLFPGRGPPAPLSPGPSPLPPPSPLLRPSPPVQAVLREPASDGAAGDLQRAVNKQDLPQARDTGQDAKVGLLICKKMLLLNRSSQEKQVQKRNFLRKHLLIFL